MAQKKLTRSSNNKVLAGVLGGLAEYFEVDATLVRVCYAALSVLSAGFPGILLYIIMALIIGGTFWELDNQPCWVMTEDEKNIDKLSSLVADVIKDVELRIANIWQKDGLKAAYNTDTDVISVTNNKGYVVRFEPIEYGENKEVTTYGIYPTAQMWELFSNTQGNRELFVEQLETKTEKTFVFCDDKGTLTNVNSRERYYDEDEELDLTQGNGRSR